MADTAALFSRVLGDDAPGESLGAIGGFLVCLDVPAGTELGVDYEVFRTGERFQGVKLLPLGVHLVIFRSREQAHGIRQGFFVRIQRHAQVLAREWSAEREELGPPRPALNLEALERAVLAFQLDDRLGAYPKQHAGRWRRLSRFLSDSVLRRCALELGAIILPGDSEAPDTSDGGVVPFFPDLPRTARFTDLRRRRADLSGEQRTAYHFDRSAMLEELIADKFGGEWRELLGELQLAFVLFLQLSSLPALEQWKQFVALLCSCERALESRTELFVAFLKTFRCQLEQIPEDFFDDELTSDNFLRPCLASLLELIGEDDAPDQIRKQGVKLRELLQNRFRWSAAPDLDEEFAPVVVSLEELQLSTNAESYIGNAESSATPLEHGDDNARIAAAFLQQQRRTK